MNRLLLKISWKQKGFVLLASILIVLLLLLLGAYLVSFITAGMKISNSQKIATQTYYLAETGIQEAIWKIKNDPTWKNNFETNPNWNTSFTRNNIFFSDDSYQVNIKNNDFARGEIIATSTIALGSGHTSQRVVKVRVFKALGSATENSVIFSGGTSENIDISASIINIYDGNLFSNHNLNISWWSQVTINDNINTLDILEGQALAVGNLNLSFNSTLTATAKCAKDQCTESCTKCPPDSILMPAVDFDSVGQTPPSYKDRAIAAGTLYTSEEFEDLLWNVGEGGTLTLNNPVTYVTGPIELKGGRSLIINGVLVANDTIDIGEKFCWSRKGDKHCGFSQIQINQPPEGGAAGLLTKSKINFGSYSSFGPINITGLVYANDELRLVSLPWEFNLRGGMLARKLAFTSVWESLNFTLDNSIISETLGNPVFSPIVTIEHWEEEY